MFHYSCQNSSGSGVERQSERERAGKKTRKMLFKIQEFTLTQSVYTRSKQKYFISRTLHSWLALVMPYRLWFNHFRSHTKRFRNKSKTEISEMNTYRWVVGMVCVCVCVVCAEQCNNEDAVAYPFIVLQATSNGYYVNREDTHPLFSFLVTIIQISHNRFMCVLGYFRYISVHLFSYTSFSGISCTVLVLLFANRFSVFTYTHTTSHS